jgi:hypothetical protein
VGAGSSAGTTERIDVKLKSKVAAGVGAAAVLAALGVGTAAVASASPAAPSTVATTAATTQAAGAEAPEPAGPDTDNVQQGDQSGPDSPAAAPGK